MTTDHTSPWGEYDSSATPDPDNFESLDDEPATPVTPDRNAELRREAIARAEADLARADTPGARIDLLRDAIQRAIGHAVDRRRDSAAGSHWVPIEDITTSPLHAVQGLTRPGVFGVPGEDVPAFLRGVWTDVLAIVDPGVVRMADNDFQALVGRLRARQTTLLAWRSFVRSVANVEAAISPAVEPDGPVGEVGFRWQGTVIDVPDVLQRRLLEYLWNHGCAAGARVRRVDALQFVYKDKGQPETNPANAFKGVIRRTNNTLAANGILFKVAPPKNRFLHLKTIPGKGTPKDTPESTAVP